MTVVNKTAMLACSKCKGKVPLNDLRADKDGKSWVCSSCYSIQHPKLRNENISQEKKVNKIQFSSDKKFKYQCEICKFKFARNSEYKGLCPYCSKEGSLQIINEDFEL